MTRTNPAASNAVSLKLSTLWLFAAPNFALAIMHIPVGLVLPAFYAKHTQISLAAIGTVLLVGRLFDALIDPVLGFVSDRTRSRFGRRKPWIVGGLPVACIAVVFLFTPPADASASYFLTWSISLFIGWTLIEIPYQAWAAELSRSYSERSRIMTIRVTFGYAGGLLFMASPILLAPWTGSSKIGAEALAIAGWGVALALPILMLLVVYRVSPGPEVAVHETTVKGLLAALRRNKPLRFYAAVFMITEAAGGAWGATAMLFIDSIGLGSQFSLLLLTAWGTRVCVSPVCLKLIHRFGKHRVWGVGLLLAGVITPLALLVPQGSFALPLMLGYAVILGAVETARLVTPPTVYGDVIDYDTLKTGADQAGSYFAVYQVMIKSSGAIGAGVAFWILSLLDYQVKGGNSGTQMFGLYLAFAIVPSLVYLAAGFFVRHFPIDARRHGIILRRIESRAARATESHS